MSARDPNNWRRRWRAARRFLVHTTIVVVPIIIERTDWGAILWPLLSGSS